jgi:hypothetical protein
MAVEASKTGGREGDQSEKNTAALVASGVADRQVIYAEDFRRIYLGGCCTSQLYKLIHAGVVPPPITVLGKSAWLKSDGEVLLRKLARSRRALRPNRGRPKKTGRELATAS